MKTVYWDGLFLPQNSKAAREVLKNLFSCRGVFETMRARQGEIYLWSRHLKRLLQGCRALGIKNPSAGDIKKAMGAFLKANTKADGVRMAVFFQAHKSSMVISARKVVDKPKISLCVVRRTGAKSLSCVKSLRRSFYDRLGEQARRKGADEAVFLAQGCLVEGSRSNIFFVKNRILHTPGLKSGCLAGVTRQRILELAKEKGFRVRQGLFSLKLFLTSEEIFCTNALRGIMPVFRLQKESLPGPCPGPVTEILQKLYQNDVEKSSTIL